MGEGSSKGCKDSAIGHENSPVGCGGVENLQGSVENPHNAPTLSCLTQSVEGSPK